jgi:DNA-directed RNA polymerase subunit E'
MYMIVDKQSTVRIPPDMFKENLKEVVDELTHKQFEGKIDENQAYIILVTDIKPIGDGRIVHGDGGIYQNVEYKALVFKPQLQEVVKGTVCEVLKFGAFVRFGPLDGLLHVSQIMDDKIDVDITSRRLVGKDTKRDLKVGDDVIARVVAVSINERNPRESKIGLTMRQNALGKLDWIMDDRNKKEVAK